MEGHHWCWIIISHKAERWLLFRINQYLDQCIIESRKIYSHSLLKRKEYRLLNISRRTMIMISNNNNNNKIRMMMRINKMKTSFSSLKMKCWEVISPKKMSKAIRKRIKKWLRKRRIMILIFRISSKILTLRMIQMLSRYLMKILAEFKWKDSRSNADQF